MILSNVEVEDFDRFWSTFSSKGLAKRKPIYVEKVDDLEA